MTVTDTDRQTDRQTVVRVVVQTTTIVIHNHNREQYIIVLGYWIMILNLFHSKFILNNVSVFQLEKGP